MATTTTLLSLTKPDGSDAAQISVINANMDILDNSVLLTNSQTLTNKTLTSPHFTTPVVDSGGLTVTTGGLTVSAGGITITGNSTINGTLGSLTGLTVASGGITVTTGGITVNGGALSLTANAQHSITGGGALAFGTNPAVSGLLRLANASAGIAWRNGGNSGDITFTMDSSDRLAITNYVAIANAATAGANALPANPYGFLRVTIEGTERKIPLYNA